MEEYNEFIDNKDENQVEWCIKHIILGEKMALDISALWSAGSVVAVNRYLYLFLCVVCFHYLVFYLYHFWFCEYLHHLLYLQTNCGRKKCCCTKQVASIKFWSTYTHIFVSFDCVWRWQFHFFPVDLKSELKKKTATGT